MKIIIEDFWYKGEHCERDEVDLPNVKNLEELTDKIQGYVFEGLDTAIKEWKNRKEGS